MNFKRPRFDKERRLAFVNATLDSDLSKEFWDGIDLFDVVIGTFHYLASTRGEWGPVDFLERFKAKRPYLYEKGRHWYDCELIGCYASLDGREKVADLITIFVDDPERRIGLLFRVLDILMLYGYAEETKRLSISAYHKLKESTEILPLGLIELQEFAITSLLRKHLLAGDAETEEVMGELESNGLHPKREAIDISLKIFKGLTREWTQKDFRKSSKDFHFNLFQLLTEFTRDMRLKHSVELVTSELFAWLLREFYYRLSGERKGRFVFSFSDEHLNEHLRGYFNTFSMAQLRGVALLPALKYFSNFLHGKGLITPVELEENVERARAKLRKVCAKEPWRYKFLLQWKLDGKPLHDEDYFKVDFPARAKKVGRGGPCPCGSGKSTKNAVGGWGK